MIEGTWMNMHFSKVFVALLFTAHTFFNGRCRKRSDRATSTKRTVRRRSLVVISDKRIVRLSGSETSTSKWRTADYVDVFSLEPLAQWNENASQWKTFGPVSWLKDDFLRSKHLDELCWASPSLVEFREGSERISSDASLRMWVTKTMWFSEFRWQIWSFDLILILFAVSTTKRS